MFFLLTHGTQNLGSPNLEIILELENEVARYRTGITTLLARQVKTAGEIERKLNVVVGDDASEREVVKDMPFGPIRLYCALLLHKARLHIFAVLDANEKNNIHSLAVQMRPVLECAGQVVHIIHKPFVDPDHIGDANEYVDRDFLGTMVRATDGQIGRQELLDRISDIRKEFDEEPLGKTRSIRQEDKVAPLHGGKEWYKLLSERFCHGNKADWRDQLWRGGVNPTTTFECDYTFGGFMDYLVRQVAVMNLYARLPLISGKMSEDSVESALDHIQQIQDEAKTLRDDAIAAVEKMKERN